MSSSLLQWLAYWAGGKQCLWGEYRQRVLVLNQSLSGFQSCMTNYAADINTLLSRMLALRPLVLPENRSAVEQHIDHVWERTTMLTSAFHRVEIDKQFRHSFEEYSQAEEQRFSQNLQTVKYIIDGQETLDLVCGSSQIEKACLFIGSLNLFSFPCSASFPSALHSLEAGFGSPTAGRFSSLARG